MTHDRFSSRHILIPGAGALALVAALGCYQSIALDSVGWALTAGAAALGAGTILAFTRSAAQSRQARGDQPKTATPPRPEIQGACEGARTAPGEKDAAPDAAAAPSHQALAQRQPGARTTELAVAAPEVPSAQADEPAAAHGGVATQAEPAPAEDGSPTNTAVDGEPAIAHSQLDYNAVSERIVQSPDPLAELKLLVGDIRTRMAQTDGEDAARELDAARLPGDAPLVPATRGTGGDATPDATILSPSPVERFVARMLVEAGLFSTDTELPRMSVVRSPHSQMLFVRVEQRELSYLARLRVLKIEAALNAMRYACTYFDDPQDVTEADCYKLTQGLATSVCAQSPGLDVPLDSEEGEDPDGEWAVRRKIAAAIEDMQLPYRLEQHFRVNVADGNVGFHVDLTPERVFPSSVFVAGLGVVQSSREMRRKAASAYAQRMAILLAATAFRASKKIRHVWVIGTVDDAHAHRCYLCVDFDRWRFRRLDLNHVDDLPRAMRPFVPNMRVENDILRPVEQTVDLADPRFSPTWRHMPVGLSSRRLPERLARALGAPSVSGLAIEETDKRSLIASDIMLNLCPPDERDATQRNVRMVMELAGNDPDPTVRSAAERLVRGMIDGTVGTDPMDIGEEFVRGDALDRACERAKECLTKHDAVGAKAVLEPVVGPVDEAGLFSDKGGVVWRYFASYVDRTLYNRQHADDLRALLLVPDAYFAAHFYLSVANLALRQTDAALAHARRLRQMAPLDKHANLQLVRCLEEAGRTDEAMATLTEFLRGAHDPEAIGLGYYRMASFQMARGNTLAAQACYQSAMSFMPSITPIVVMEVTGLAAQSQGEKGGLALSPMSQQEVEATLGYHGVPVAPTDEVSKTFLECTRASMDAEVYPVARNFVSVLAAFDPDDVILQVLDSMEGVPDQ